MKHLVYYSCYDIKEGYSYNGAEIVDSVAEWSIAVKALKRLKSIEVTFLSSIKMTEEQAKQWKAV